ncbi:unnamed protein product [Didymodactylos carnosus]|uniref:Phosphoglycerate mutase-like protein n=1 Tax=Didymodactylos carnosus TaxID=1234261 RepID=A0A814YNW9_9BILA|nr:unnamed protein product [Didymodactylos carnosus]CAF1557402.1 unnamed protein product [Didymodactylos carnosus]CAF3994730.1 unnamed protein product [Didymodactylos carnosus]CAF4348581.1 unnamed protein product [Didymodactylos carnosus]
MSEKTIFYLRHCQAEHNVNNEYNIQDPRLTQIGIEHAKKIILPPNLELVVCSPFVRTLQTYQILFPGKEIPLIIEPDLQEVSMCECDIGSSVETLVEQFPDLARELQRDLKHDWNEKTKDQCTKEAIQKRAEKIRYLLHKRSERKILVISHNCFLHGLVGEHFENGEIKEQFANEQLKTYSVAPHPQKSRS